jgi:NADPH-dependent 7-cyano-7-deazaguanine reductase QueF
MGQWEKIRADALQSIKSPCNHLHEITSEEFSMFGALGQPDQAKLSIDLDIKEGAPAPELKSVKKYLHQYRDVCMSYERAAMLIRDHFMEVYDPSNVDVTLEFKPRGGLTSNVKTWAWNEVAQAGIKEALKDG